MNNSSTEPLNEFKSNINPIIFSYRNKNEDLNQFEGEELILGYQNVLLFFDYLDKAREHHEDSNATMNMSTLETGLRIINSTFFVSDDAEKNSKHLQDLCTFLTQQRWNEEVSEFDDLRIQAAHGNIEEEDIRTFMEMKKQFDYAGDFDLLYGLFLEKWNIDLLENNINWWIFNMLINCLFEEDTNCLIERLKARQFEPEKGKGMGKYNRAGEKRKMKYAYYIPKEKSKAEEIDTPDVGVTMGGDK